MIREANINDAEALAAIHVAALPNDLLPRLGTQFLSTHFYRVVLRSEHAFTILDEEDHAIRSFIIFAHNSNAVTKQVMGKKFSLLWHLFIAVPRDPSILGEIIGHLKGFKTELISQPNETIEKTPELYLMATAPEHHSKGIGSRLIQRGLEVLAQRNLQCIVKTSSDIAKKFYLKNHFEEIGTEFRHKRKLHILLYRPHKVG